MARGITYDEVCAVADKIMAQAGKDPTLRDIRDALGTGSMSTVHKHLLAWRASLPPVAAAVPDLPANLAREIALAISRAAAEGRAECEARLVQAQAEAADLAAAGETMEAELDLLNGQVRDISNERQALAVTVAAQAADLTRISGELQRERQATDSARTEVAQGRNKIDNQCVTIDEQAAEITRLQAECNAETSARIAAEKASAVLEARLEAAREQIEAARHDISRLTAQVDRERQIGEQERVRADEQQKLAAEVRVELADLKARLVSLNEKKRLGGPKRALDQKTQVHGQADALGL